MSQIAMPTISTGAVQDDIRLFDAFLSLAVTQQQAEGLLTPARITVTVSFQVVLPANGQNLRFRTETIP